MFVYERTELEGNGDFLSELNRATALILYISSCISLLLFFHFTTILNSI